MYNIVIKKSHVFKREIILGILICFITAFISMKLSNHLGEEILKFEKSPVSPIIIAIFIGILFSNIKLTYIKKFKIGYDFCIRYLLKLGIIFLGIRLSFIDLLQYGSKGLLVVIPTIVITILLVQSLSTKFMISKKLSLLIAVGTSICGATAIAALAPAINAKKTEVAYAIANITIFGLFAMFLYPIISNVLFLNNSISVGLFLGTSIHETAQVAGSAMIYSVQYQNQQVIAIATITKLLRNTLMIIVIPYLAQKNISNDKQSKKIGNVFPYFVVGFIFFGLLRTIGDYFYSDASVWINTISTIKYLAEFLLIISMAAIGFNTSFLKFKELGSKPFIIGLISASTVGISSILIISIINYYRI